MPIRPLVRMLFLLVCGMLAGVGPAHAQAVPFEQIASALGSVHQFSQVALSPDGRRFAYVESVGDRSAIRLADVARPGVAHTITACPGRRCDEGDVAWAPDGRRLAFVTTDARGQSQVAVGYLRRSYSFNLGQGLTKLLEGAQWRTVGMIGRFFARAPSGSNLAEHQAEQSRLRGGEIDVGAPHGR